MPSTFPKNGMRLFCVPEDFFFSFFFFIFKVQTFVFSGVFSQLSFHLELFYLALTWSIFWPAIAVHTGRSGCSRRGERESCSSLTQTEGKIVWYRVWQVDESVLLLANSMWVVCCYPVYYEGFVWRSQARYWNGRDCIEFEKAQKSAFSAFSLRLG